jgi:hypothetical protein
VLGGKENEQEDAQYVQMKRQARICKRDPQNQREAIRQKNLPYMQV